MPDMEDVIMDSITDSMTEDMPTDTATPDSPTDQGLDTAAPEATIDNPSNETPTPGSAQPSPDDDFNKRFGLPANQFGRENRIPHTRVRQMVTKAEADAKTKLQKDFDARLATEFTPKITEYESKLQDYESRLTKVGEFEQVMMNDPKSFLGMLQQVPAYQPFFAYLQELASKAGSPEAAPTNPAEGMPQPDQKLDDGTTVYSMEGLQKLLDWQSKNVENRVEQRFTRQFQERIAPIEQERQQAQSYARAQASVNKQLEEARKWDRFGDLEPEITKIMAGNINISLDRAYLQAYQQSVIPKLSTDHNTVRQQVLAEMKQRPVSTSAPTTASKPAQPVRTGPRDIEDIIREEMAKFPQN